MQPPQMGDSAFIETCHRWLLFHYHCNGCESEEACEYGKVCAYGKSVFTHVRACSRTECTFPRCDLVKNILLHHLSCKDSSCQVCAPVCKYQARSKTPAVPTAPPAAPPPPPPPPPAQQPLQLPQLKQHEPQHHYHQQQGNHGRHHDGPCDCAEPCSSPDHHGMQHSMQVCEPAPSPGPSLSALSPFMMDESSPEPPQPPSVLTTPLPKPSPPLSGQSPQPPPQLQLDNQQVRQQPPQEQPQQQSWMGSGLFAARQRGNTQQQQQQQHLASPSDIFARRSQSLQAEAASAAASAMVSVASGGISSGAGGGVPSTSSGTAAGSGGGSPLGTAPSGSLAALTGLQALALDRQASPQAQPQLSPQGHAQLQLQQQQQHVHMQQPQQQQQNGWLQQQGASSSGAFPAAAQASFVPHAQAPAQLAAAVGQQLYYTPGGPIFSQQQQQQQQQQQAPQQPGFASTACAGMPMLAPAPPPPPQHLTGTGVGDPQSLGSQHHPALPSGQYVLAQPPGPAGAVAASQGYMPGPQQHFYMQAQPPPMQHMPSPHAGATGAGVMLGNGPGLQHAGSQPLMAMQYGAPTGMPQPQHPQQPFQPIGPFAFSQQPQPMFGGPAAGHAHPPHQQQHIATQALPPQHQAHQQAGAAVPMQVHMQMPPVAGGYYVGAQQAGPMGHHVAAPLPMGCGSSAGGVADAGVGPTWTLVQPGPQQQMVYHQAHPAAAGQGFHPGMLHPGSSAAQMAGAS